MEEIDKISKREKFIKNWNAKSPIRNKRITDACATIVTIAGIIATLPLMGFIIPATLVTYATITVAVGTTLGIKSKLTVEKPKSNDAADEE